mmetsp:Transcript_296/g.631  ORF Transcript_296/g.631 Transcript_296/m.631 type:complete len:665 (+) Transcript_296:71-2065(+)
MTALKATMPIHGATTTTTTTTAWKNRSSRQQRISFTAFFLTCTAFIYILVLGTQFKMMSILGDHNDRTVASASNAAIGMDTGIRNNDLAMIVPPGHYHNLAELKRKATLTMRRKKNGDDGDGDGDGKIGRMGVVSHHRRHDKLAFENRRQQALGMIANGGNDNGALLSPPEKNDHRPELDNEIAQSNDDEATNTAPNNENTNAQRHYQKSAASIAQKWNLTAFNSIFLLEQQFAKVNDYDPHNDFFHFHHLYKSGGTSISNLMDKTVGLPKSPPREGGGKGYEGILPGSYESGNFDHDEALADIRRRMAAGTRREDLPYKASYAHTGLRPVYGPKRTVTGEFLLEHLPPEKRLRVITMLRDPTDFRASNHAMIMCGLNYEVSRFNNERRERGLLSQVCTPRDGLNVSALVDRKISNLMEKCRKADEMERRGEKVTLNNALRYQCRREKNGVDTREYCRSAGHLLASKEYDKHYRSMFKGLMGRFHRGQEFTNSTAYGRMGYGFERAENSHGYSVENVEEYTLQDLGGLDTKTISGAGDGVGHPPEPDFIWFGITERMKESTTLFYYYFKAKPLAKTPDNRVQPCRPTSWWSKEDREEVRRREPADYAVWRAANAIMDVRMEKMRVEIQAALDAGETKESLYYVDWDQLEEIGYKLENQKLVMSK